MEWFDGATQHSGTLSDAIKTLFTIGLFVVARAPTQGQSYWVSGLLFTWPPDSTSNIIN
jgi:hypothetical protein